ncbi:MAG TPA: hypothetical protein VMZ29_14405 [Candidatus Bathyarchaeia archaeon]|nr:hypothetical protein [Candidatus Bathyarchaeia archaeon]
MALSEDIVKLIDTSRNQLTKIYEKLDPNEYSKFYKQIWGIRADMEYIVISLKLLNDITNTPLDEKWKDEFASTLKQVRAERKIRQEFLETIELYKSLENINQILNFYKVCWMIKEKLTILLNVVKPKFKLEKNNLNKKDDDL